MTLRHRLRSLVPPRWRRASERGSASIEMLLIFPAFVVFTFAAIQGGLWYQARSAAEAAATTALDAARVYQADNADGVSAGRSFIADHTSLRNGSVNVSRNNSTVTVTVNGQSTAILPGIAPGVSTTVSGPIERWVN